MWPIWQSSKSEQWYHASIKTIKYDPAALFPCRNSFCKEDSVPYFSGVGTQKNKGNSRWRGFELKNDTQHQRQEPKHERSKTRMLSMQVEKGGFDQKLTFIITTPTFTLSTLEPLSGKWSAQLKMCLLGQHEGQGRVRVEAGTHSQFLLSSLTSYHIFVLFWKVIEV